jgi:hypothetical protein
MKYYPSLIAAAIRTISDGELDRSFAITLSSSFEPNAKAPEGVQLVDFPHSLVPDNSDHHQILGVENVWKQHIRCRQNQQVRGHQGGCAEVLS